MYHLCTNMMYYLWTWYPLNIEKYMTNCSLKTSINQLCFIIKYISTKHIAFFIDWIVKLVYFYISGALWSWSHASWIYNYLCNQCLSPLTLWLRVPPRRGVLSTPLCDKVSQWLATDRCFSPLTPLSSTNKIDRLDKYYIVGNSVKHHNYNTPVLFNKHTG
jgi:hypothetical protein